MSEPLLGLNYQDQQLDQSAALSSTYALEQLKV